MSSQPRYISKRSTAQTRHALAGRADLRDGRPRARAGPGLGGLGVASRRPPHRATTRRPGGRATRGLAGRVEGCPRAAARSDSARSTGRHTDPACKIVNDRRAVARHHDCRQSTARAKRWGAYRARLAVNSRTRPDSAGRDEGRPTSLSVLVRDCLCWVAGHGFEPWKASADGFTDRCRATRA